MMAQNESLCGDELNVRRMSRVDTMDGMDEDERCLLHYLLMAS